MPQPMIRKRTLDCLPQQGIPWPESPRNALCPLTTGQTKVQSTQNNPGPHSPNVPHPLPPLYTQTARQPPSRGTYGSSLHSGLQVSGPLDREANSPVFQMQTPRPLAVKRCRSGCVTLIYGICAVTSFCVHTQRRSSCPRTLDCHSRSVKEGLQRWLSG